jgi:hypothetical protein
LVAAAPESTIVIPPERDSSAPTLIAQAPVDARDPGTTSGGTIDSAPSAPQEIPDRPDPRKPPAPGLLAGPVVPETPPPLIATSAPKASDVTENRTPPVRDVPPPASREPVTTAKEIVAPKVRARADTRSAPVATPKRADKPIAVAARPARIRWVPTTVRGWITVRASADKRSRALASLGPDTRVQLGEWRGAWVRIRSRGITGWVDGSHPWNIGIASTSGARGLTR